jgi:hypothetical protein
MRTVIRVGVFAGILLAGLRLSGPRLSQDRGTLTLPANWGKLQADYSEKIVALEKQLKEMRRKRSRP